MRGLVARPVPQRPLAILAYGSLLHSPGPLGPLVTGVVPCRTPFPVEYGRASQRWNGGPVLVPHPDGGPVDGGLLVMDANGKRLGMIATGARVSNATFGDDGRTLYLTSHTFLARIRVNAMGIGFER